MLSTANVDVMPLSEENRTVSWTQICWGRKTQFNWSAAAAAAGQRLREPASRQSPVVADNNSPSLSLSSSPQQLLDRIGWLLFGWISRQTGPDTDRHCLGDSGKQVCRRPADISKSFWICKQAIRLSHYAVVAKYEILFRKVHTSTG